MPRMAARAFGAIVVAIASMVLFAVLGSRHATIGGVAFGLAWFAAATFGWIGMKRTAGRAAVATGVAVIFMFLLFALGGDGLVGDGDPVSAIVGGVAAGLVWFAAATAWSQRGGPTAEGSGPQGRDG